MVIREAGLMCRGFTLINGFYHQTSKKGVDKELRAGMLTAMLNFAETSFSSGNIEYIEGNKFVIAFTNGEISSNKDIGPEPLVAYSIIDKEKKIDKHVKKIIIPMLKKIIEEFKANFNGKNLSKVSQFRGFKKNLDKIFGMETKKIDERLSGVF